MMNLCITRKDKSQEIISGIVNAKHVPADGADTETYFQPGSLLYLDAFKPTNIVLTLADGTQRTVELAGVQNHQYLSDDELADGYTFLKPV